MCTDQHHTSIYCSLYMHMISKLYHVYVNKCTSNYFELLMLFLKYSDFIYFKSFFFFPIILGQRLVRPAHTITISFSKSICEMGTTDCRIL